MTRSGAGTATGHAGAVRRRLPDRLPPLKEAWLPAYRGVWIALFLLALLMSAGGVYVRAVSAEGLTTPFERAGLMIGERQSGLRIRLTVGDEAAASGLKAGDAIVAIDGTAVPDDPSADDQIGERLDGPAESKVRITARSPDGTLRTHSLTRSQRHLDQAFERAGLSRIAMRMADFADVLTTALLLAASALLFRRRARDPVAILLSLGLLMALAASGSSEYLIMRIGGDAFFDALLMVGWAGLLLAILTFPDGRFDPRWTLAAALLLPVGGVIGLLHDSVGTFTDMAFMVAGVLAIAVRYRRLPQGDQRQQIRWALLGFGAGAFFILIDQALLFAYNHAPSTTVGLWCELLHYLAYATAFACIPLGLLISLLRYRLYDADAAISRSAAFAALTVLLSALFAGSMNGMEAIIQASFGRDAGAEAPAVAAAFTAIMVAPAHNRLHRWAEQRFQKALEHLRRDLPECVADMRETSSLEVLLQEVLGRVSRGVRATRAAVIIGEQVAAVRDVTAEETAAWLEVASLSASSAALGCERGDPLFPMRVPLRVRHLGGAPIGWILLGPRPDGSFYGKDEQEALAEIADPVARAVQIVLLREQREAAGREEIALLHARLASLEEAIGSAPRAEARS